LERDKAFGHICPKYAIDLLDEKLLNQMIERTVDGVDHAVLDKGLKGYQRKKIEVGLRNSDLEIEQR
jgi:D-tyrosyl-tRNA(Tyr) deacylase